MIADSLLAGNNFLNRCDQDAFPADAMFSTSSFDSLELVAFLFEVRTALILTT